MDLADFKKENIVRLRDWLKDEGFDTEALTDDQVNLIHEPNEAPENFHCDGEFSFNECFRMWVGRLNNAKVPLDVIKQSIKYNFN